MTFLDMFLKHPNIKDLRILRIYSKSIETKYHYGPHSCKVQYVAILGECIALWGEPNELSI